MSIYKTELSLKDSKNLYSRFAFERNRQENISDIDGDTDFLGKFLHNGKVGWIAKGNSLEVLCMKSGNKLAMFNFDDYIRTGGCIISCVQEVTSGTLVIVLQNRSNGFGCLIAIVTIQGSNLKCLIDLPYDRITTCEYISNSCFNNFMRNFDKYLIVGTNQGNLILLDLCIDKGNKYPTRYEDNSHADSVEIVDITMKPEKIDHQHRQAKKLKNHFGIQLEVLDDPSTITSILQIRKHSTLAIGFSDGSMVLYDLESCAAYHLAYPPEEKTPLINLVYLEPIEDPRPCIYIWAFHASRKGAIAVMHSVMFSRRLEVFEEYSYKNFQSCTVCLTMPFYDLESIPLTLQPITKKINQEQEELSVCVMSWISSDKVSTILIFDLNQWYKEQMPTLCDWRESPTYTLTFTIEENDNLPVDFWLDSDSIVPFNSIQRPEEHFYPNSLSFDIKSLSSMKSNTYYWSGIQNKALELLNLGGPICILNPSEWYRDMLHVALIPQFIDNSYNLSIEDKREFLLSIALEYNITDLLKKCAVLWSDGSQQGQDPYEGVSLSTLTNWIFKRAKDLKSNSNRLCIPLFDLSGREIDSGTQNNLKHCSRQLKILADVMHMVLKQCGENIPDNVFDMLKSHSLSIKMASDYQEVLQWLLNVGILPEGIYTSNSPPRFMGSSRILDNANDFNEEFQIVPYPFEVIKSFYQSQRSKFAANSGHINIPSKYLFIDMFIKNECGQDTLKELGMEINGNGIYPPSSLQAILRVLLLNDITFENKYVLLTYLFLDINSILSEGRYSSTVQNLIKFPTVFRLNPSIIKRTQAFWFLDHGHLETAIEELISPLSHNRHLPLWQSELVIQTLLKQNSPNMALKVLQAPGTKVSPEITIQTLLSNNLISEAFEFQRTQHNDELLLYFFNFAFKIDKCNLLLDLALNERENEIFIEFLRKSDDYSSTNLQLTYLLQRSKFFDILKLINDGAISNEYTSNSFRDILLLYHSTLGPTTKYLTSLTSSNREKFQLKEDDIYPEPLSKGLISNSLDMKNAIFEKTIMNIKGVANNFYMRTENNEINNIPFLRKQVFHIPKPQVAYEEESVKSETIRASLNQPNKRSRDSMSTYDDDRSSNTHVSIINLDEIAASQPPAKKKRFCISNTSTSIKESEPYKNISTRVIKTIKNKKMFSKSMPYSRNDSSRLSRTPERSILPSAKSLLHTPIISKVYENPSGLGSYTPHSILKSDRSSCCSTPSNIDMEVKSLKFTSPLSETLNSTNKSFQECENFSFVEDEKDDNLFDKFLASGTANPKESTNDAVQCNSLDVFNGPTPRKSLRSRSKTPIEEDVIREENILMETDSAENENTVEVVIQDTNNMESDSNGNENAVQVVIQDSNSIENQLSDMAPTTLASSFPSNVYDLRSRTKTPEKILSSKNIDENIVNACSLPALPEIPYKRPLNRLLLEANVKKYFDEFKKQNEDTNTSMVVPSEMMKKINETLSANDTIDSDVSIINNYTSILDDTGFNETFMRKFEEKHQISSTNTSVLDESMDMIQKTHYLNSSLEATAEVDVNEKERDKSQGEPKEPTTESVILIDSLSESSDDKSDKENEEKIISESDDEVAVDAEKYVSEQSSGSYGDNIDLADEDDEELEDEYDEEDESVVDDNDSQENEEVNDVNTSGDDSRDGSSYSDSNSKDSNTRNSSDEGSVIAISSSDEAEDEGEPLPEKKIPVQVDQPKERNTTVLVEPQYAATIPEVLNLSQTVDNSDLLYGFDNDDDVDVEVEVEQNEELECAQIYDDDFEITVSTRSDEIIDREESTTVEVNTIYVAEQTAMLMQGTLDQGFVETVNQEQTAMLMQETLDQGFVETVNQEENVNFQNSVAEETIVAVDAMDIDENQPNISNITSDTSTVFQSFTEDNHDVGFVSTEMTVPGEDNVNPQEHTAAEEMPAEGNLNLQIGSVEERQEPSLYIFKDPPDHKVNPDIARSVNISVTSVINTESIAGEVNMPTVSTKEAVDEPTSDVSLRIFKDLPIAENVDGAETSSNNAFERVCDTDIDKTSEETSFAPAIVLISEKSAENSLFLFKDLPETSQANPSIVEEGQNSKSVTEDSSKLVLDEKKIKLFQDVVRPGSETNTEINSDSSDSRKLEIDMDEESRENQEIDIEKTEEDLSKIKNEYRDKNIEDELADGGGRGNHEDTLTEKKIYMLRSTSMTNVASPIERVFTRGASAPRSEQLTAEDLALRTPKRKARRNSTTSEPGTPLTPLRRSSRHLSTNSLTGENLETEVNTLMAIKVSDESKSVRASKSNIKTSKTNDLKETESHTIASASLLEQGKRIRTRSISKSEDHSDAESDISVISTASATKKRLRSTVKKQNVAKTNSSEHETSESGTENTGSQKKKLKGSSSSTRDTVKRKLMTNLTQIPEEPPADDTESNATTEATKSRSRGRPKKN